jgi:hypothetical protein
VTIGQKRYYFSPYPTLLYKSGSVTIKDYDESVTFKETSSNLNFQQIKELVTNCSGCGCDSVPIIATSPSGTIDINVTGSGVTELDVVPSALISNQANNQLITGNDGNLYVSPTAPPTDFNVVNLVGFSGNAPSCPSTDNAQFYVRNFIQNGYKVTQVAVQDENCEETIIRSFRVQL